MEPYSIVALLGLFLGLLLTGALAGVMAGLLGVGGGIVIVPILIIFADIFGLADEIAMLLVVGTSLATIIPTSIASARAHHARGAVDMHIVRQWVPAMFLGALSGGFASTLFGSSGLAMVFGIVGLIVSVNLAIPHTRLLADNPPRRLLLRSLFVYPIGFISALMGIGGGSLLKALLSSG